MSGYAEKRMTMRFGVNMPNFGAFGDARALADLAREAEEHGWDGVFLWDHIGADWGADNTFADPWIALTAMAMQTSKITLGTVVTPLPRRRPWKVAREAVTLDHLSGGRLILGVGIGSDFGQEYSCYGESTDDSLHGAMLDEALEVITGLWSGEPFSFKGAHYQVHGARYQPTPVHSGHASPSGSRRSGHTRNRCAAPRAGMASAHWWTTIRCRQSSYARLWHTSGHCCQRASRLTCWPTVARRARMRRRRQRWWRRFATLGPRGGRRVWRQTTRSNTRVSASGVGRQRCQPSSNNYLRVCECRRPGHGADIE
jgi:Luciferase-like monooxygenase